MYFNDSSVLFSWLTYICPFFRFGRCTRLITRCPCLGDLGVNKYSEIDYEDTPAHTSAAGDESMRGLLYFFTVSLYPVSHIGDQLSVYTMD